MQHVYLIKMVALVKLTSHYIFYLICCAKLGFVSNIMQEKWLWKNNWDKPAH